MCITLRAGDSSNSDSQIARLWGWEGKKKKGGLVGVGMRLGKGGEVSLEE